MIRGQPAGQRQFDQTLRRIAISPMFVGRSGMPPVVNEVNGVYTFTGTIECVRIDIEGDREVATPASYID